MSKVIFYKGKKFSFFKRTTQFSSANNFSKQYKSCDERGNCYHIFDNASLVTLLKWFTLDLEDVFRNLNGYEALNTVALESSCNSLTPKPEDTDFTYHNTLLTLS